MRVDYLTIFPGLISGVLEYGLLRQGQIKGLLEFHVHNLRDFARDAHRSVDDEAYGGGPGMVFKPEPIFEAVDWIREPQGSVVILPEPQGQVLTASLAKDLAGKQQLIFICGRYEGVDERVREALVHMEISIGDYVTMGGELPALIITEVVARFLPGIVGDQQSVEADSFEGSLLDYPHYTRPVEYRNLRVPEVLLSGHHEKIRRWRRKMALKRTLERRPDILAVARLTEEDRQLLEEIKKGIWD